MKFYSKMWELGMHLDYFHLSIFHELPTKGKFQPQINIFCGKTPAVV